MTIAEILRKTVDADKAIIEAARSLPAAEQTVTAGSPEWDVLARWGGDPGTWPEMSEWDGRMLWVALTSMTHPRVPFVTPCPSWCSLDEHSDDILSDDHETQITDHVEPISQGKPYVISLVREDRRLDGVVTIGTPVISVFTEDVREWSPDLLADFVADVHRSAIIEKRLAL